MELAKQLQLLQAAEGDPARLALAAVDFAFPELSDAERMTLRETFEVAAIPLRSLRMQHEGSLETKLAIDQIGDLPRVHPEASRSKRPFQNLNCVFDRQQIDW